MLYEHTTTDQNRLLLQNVFQYCEEFLDKIMNNKNYSAYFYKS